MKKILFVICLSFCSLASVDEVVVYKHERVMELRDKGSLVKEYKIRLSIKQNNPWFEMGHKKVRGDNKTPEGTYKVIKKVNAKWSRFLPSLLINYPNAKDKQEGLANGFTVKELGDAIQIHGEPKRPNKALKNFVLKYFDWMFETESELDQALRKYVYPIVDWTNGCVAVSDAEMSEIYSLVKVGTPVKIYRFRE